MNFQKPRLIFVFVISRLSAIIFIAVFFIGMAMFWNSLVAKAAIGNAPIVLSKWEMNAEKDVNGKYIGSDDSISSGAQFIRTEQQDKTIAICAVATDPDGLGDVQGVYADIYYPNSNFMQEKKLIKLSKSDAIDILCNKIKNNNNNLPTFNAGFNYAEICNSDGELIKETAAAYCSEVPMPFSNPSGNYIARIVASDIFGNNSPILENSFNVNTINYPPSLSNPNQYKSSGMSLIKEGDATIESMVVFKADVSDPDNNQVKLQVELRRFGESFTGNIDSGVLTSSLVNSGSEAIVVKIYITEGKYHWRARAIDDRGNVSDWQEFGQVKNMDFAVLQNPPPNSSFVVDFDSISYGNVMLNTHKIISGDLTFETNNRPTIKNISNKNITIFIKQDDMGFGVTSGQWDVVYDARIGSSSVYTSYFPNQVIPLSWVLHPGETEELDVSINVLKFSPTHISDAYAGVMTLSDPSSGQTVNIAVGLTKSIGGGIAPIIKSKWEANLDKYTDDSTTVGAQFMPLGKKITVCAVATDPNGTADINGVYADIYYPNGSLMEKYGLTQLDKMDGYDIFCNRVDNNNNNLPTFNTNFNYDEICSVTGELQEETAVVYCSEVSMPLGNSSGNYTTKVFAQDKSGMNSAILENYFTLLPLIQPPQNQTPFYASIQNKGGLIIEDPLNIKKDKYDTTKPEPEISLVLKAYLYNDINAIKDFQCNYGYLQPAICSGDAESTGFGRLGVLTTKGIQKYLKNVGVVKIVPDGWVVEVLDPSCVDKIDIWCATLNHGEAVDSPALNGYILSNYLKKVTDAVSIEKTHSVPFINLSPNNLDFAGYSFDYNITEGDEIERLQMFLRTEGFEIFQHVGNFTQSFGPETKMAIRRFQNKYSIFRDEAGQKILCSDNPDDNLYGCGILTKDTIDKINQLLNTRYKTDSGVKAEIVAAIDHYGSSDKISDGTLYDNTYLFHDNGDNYLGTGDSQFPIKLYLAILAQEIGGQYGFDNEWLTAEFDPGHGIGQITYPLAEKSLLGLYNCPNSECYNLFLGKSGSAIRKLYSKYKLYTNTVQGIYANIKDSLGILQKKIDDVQKRKKYFKAVLSQDCSGTPTDFSVNELMNITATSNYNGSLFQAQAIYMVHQEKKTNEQIFDYYLTEKGFNFSNNSKRFKYGGAWKGSAFSAWDNDKWLDAVRTECKDITTYKACLTTLFSNADSYMVKYEKPIILVHSYLTNVADKIGNFGSAYEDDILKKKIKCADNSKVVAMLGSPASLRVVSAEGNITGFVGDKLKEEVSNSIYDVETDIITQFFPNKNDVYQVIGEDMGTYDFVLVLGDLDQVVNIQNIPTTLGQIHQYSIDWNALENNENGVTMQIDKEGDGVVDQTVNTGATFSDAIAPTSEISVSGIIGDNEWYTSDVQVTLSANDNNGGVGVEKIEYSLDDGRTWTKYNGPFTITEEGKYSLYYRSVDYFDNTEQEKGAGIKIDKTPPILKGYATTDPNQNGWYNYDVIVHFEGYDETSEIVSITPDVTITTNGFNQSVSGVAVDSAGNKSEYIVEGINIDKISPEITFNQPFDGVQYLLYENILANWQTSDSLSGIDVSSGTVENGQAVDTNSVGKKIFEIVSTDKAGNTITKSIIYHVQYDFSGFLPPIKIDGSSIFKLNSTIPVKFQLKNANGNFISNAIAYIYAAKISDVITGNQEVISVGEANVGNLFRYDNMDNQYIFNLGTKNLLVGTWQLIIKLDDGTENKVNLSLK